MPNFAEIWAHIKQMLTSRTIWGTIVMLASMVNIDLTGLDVALANAGDAVMAAIGALMVLVGYVDRRSKPGTISVKAPA